MSKHTDHHDLGEQTPPVTLIEREPAKHAEPRTVTAWGEAKGMLPQWLSGGGPGGERRLNPEYWKLAAAVAFKKWELTAQISETDFDAAVADVQQHVSR
jgi:hypothetical protein